MINSIGNDKVASQQTERSIEQNRSTDQRGPATETQTPATERSGISDTLDVSSAGQMINQSIQNRVVEAPLESYDQARELAAGLRDRLSNPDSQVLMAHANMNPGDDLLAALVSA